MNFPAKFKGIWIPKEIWVRDDLSTMEKVALASIWNLEDDQFGCDLSNQFMANYLQIEERGLQKILSVLKSKKLISIAVIRGNYRIIRTNGISPKLTPVLQDTPPVLQDTHPAPQDVSHYIGKKELKKGNTGGHSRGSNFDGWKGQQNRG